MQKRLKVLYAIQGTGNGHVSRARSLFPVLAEHFDVDLALVGGNSEVELPVKPVWSGKGISMVYSKSGRVHIWKTLRSNSLTRFKRELKEIPVEQYDFILNDFESVSVRAAKSKGVPVLALSHQYAVTRPKAPKAKVFMPIGAFVLKHYAPVEKGIGFHFDRFDKNVLPPIIREDVRSQTNLMGKRILVYLPAYSSDKIQKVLERLPYRFTVFHKEVKNDHENQNVRWKNINAEKFSASLLRAKAVISSAGFELPSECVHLGIPLIVIPIKGQYEQYCNAAALEELGVQKISSLKSETLLLALHKSFQRVVFPRPQNDVRTEVVDEIKDWWSRMRK